jgi:hypothetical protein
VAEQIVAGLAWRATDSPAGRRLARGRASALANQVASLLAAGWTAHEVLAALAEAPGVRQAPDPAAQERLWRGALKRAKNARDRSERLVNDPPSHDPSTDR